MVTRGIVEAVLNEYSYKVRIPIFDRIEADAEHTDYNSLSTAVASIPKGLNNSIKVGDVIFLTFENNNLTEPIIIGQLYREAITNDVTAAFSGRYLEITDEAKLPSNTTIGTLSYDKLFMLSNVKYDIQRQIDKLTHDLGYANDEDLETIRDEISKLYDAKDSLEKDITKFNESLKEAEETIKSVTGNLEETTKKTAEEVASLIADLEPLAKWNDDVSEKEGIAGFVAKANADSALIGDIVTWKNGDGEESFAGTIQKVTANYATTEQVSKVNDNVAIIKTLAEKNKAAIEAVTKADGSIAGLQAQVDENKASITTLASHVIGDYVSIHSWDEAKAVKGNIYYNTTTKKYHYHNEESWIEVDAFSALPAALINTNKIYYVEDIEEYWYYDAEDASPTWKNTEKAYEAGLISALAGIQQTADANTANISMITNLEGSFGKAVAGVASKAAEENAEIKALAEYGYTDVNGNKHYGAAGIMSEVNASKSQIEAIAGKDGKIAGLQAEVDKNTAAVNLLASQTIGDYITVDVWNKEAKDITKIYYCKDTSDCDKRYL